MGTERYRIQANLSFHTLWLRLASLLLMCPLKVTMGGLVRQHSCGRILGLAAARMGDVQGNTPLLCEFQSG